MLRTFIRLIVAANCLWLATTAAPAQAPSTIPFQGRLTSATGATITNAAQPIILSLYTAASGGTPIYTENQTVSVSNGLFTTAIGSANPSVFASLPFSQPYWVGIRVGSDPEMTPRIPMSAAPYANLARKVADNAITSSGLALDPDSLLRVSGGTISNVSGNIYVNTATHINGGNILEFGAGIAGKEQDAGKIGYGTFTQDTLDIVGAGSTANQRRIKFHAEGGAVFSGPLSINSSLSVGTNTKVGGNVNVVGYLGVGDITPQGPLHVKGEGGILLLEGADHAYIEYYPRGYYYGRRAYIGFPSAFSTTLEIANEFGGAVRVIGTFVNNSDARYKTNIAPLDGALDSVMKLRGVSYDWRKDLPGVHLPDQRQVGFIAQDVEKVLPDLVYTEPDGDKSVAYVNMIPVLVEAMKAQQGQIAALKAEVERLKR